MTRNPVASSSSVDLLASRQAGARAPGRGLGAEARRARPADRDERREHELAFEPARPRGQAQEAQARKRRPVRPPADSGGRRPPSGKYAALLAACTEAGRSASLIRQASV